MQNNKESVKWGNYDIDLYYQFLQSKNPTGYTICPVYSHEGDRDEFSTFDIIQLKRTEENNYSFTPQFVEIKSRRKYSINGLETAIVDLPKIQELQKYGRENNMEVYIVNIWMKDNDLITIHKIDLEKDYSAESDLFQNINKQTAQYEIKGKKRMVHLPLKGVKRYDWKK